MSWLLDFSRIQIWPAREQLRLWHTSLHKEPFPMKSLFKMLVVVCLLGTTYGQTADSGRFGASEDHAYDSIDLATLVPTFTFPVISKPGAIPLGVSIVSPQVCHLDSFLARWVCGGNNEMAAFKKVFGSALWNMSATSYVTG